MVQNLSLRIVVSDEEKIVHWAPRASKVSTTSSGTKVLFSFQNDIILSMTPCTPILATRSTRSINTLETERLVPRKQSYKTATKLVLGSQIVSDFCGGSTI